MKRRDVFRLIPLGLAGVSGINAQAQNLIPPGTADDCPLSLTYTKNVIKLLKGVRETQSEKIVEAGHAIARTIMNKGNIWCMWDLGHTSKSDIFDGRNGKPEFLVHGYDEKKVRKGDCVLAGFPGPYIQNLYEKDLFVIARPGPWGGDVADAEKYIKPEIAKDRIRPVADIWIDTKITHIGAQVKVPGSIAPLGPESGPLGCTLFWMMVSDACRVLALNGKSAKIEGDEPKLPDDAPRINLADPLMDNYFDEVIRQMGMIGGELGNIRKIAQMAADTLLDGGNVYFYSKDPQSFANEASGRRGGFAFAKGLSDGRINGTSKDCVIMGVFEPADEADLKNLDDFKNRGMRVASIGPTTCNFKRPEGRAVFKETEVHAGYMMDTYGIFAIPGFERKVCPTSGALNTSILWVMSVELVEEVIRRTGGNTPAIYFNGALKWARDDNNQARAMMEYRGY
jgi:uncharacterized phosphosugar-binding protein